MQHFDQQNKLKKTVFVVLGKKIQLTLYYIIIIHLNKTLS